MEKARIFLKIEGLSSPATTWGIQHLLFNVILINFEKKESRPSVGSSVQERLSVFE